MGVRFLWCWLFTSLLQNWTHYHSALGSHHGGISRLSVWKPCIGHPYWHELIRRSVARGNQNGRSSVLLSILNIKFQYNFDTKLFEIWRCIRVKLLPNWILKRNVPILKDLRKLHASGAKRGKKCKSRSRYFCFSLWLAGFSRKPPHTDDITTNHWRCYFRISNKRESILPFYQPNR